MKKYILLFIIIALPVFCFAQDGANAKKPSVDGAKEENKTENPIENNKIDQTEESEKNYIKGEPIELYDLIYMLLPDDGEIEKEVEWGIENSITALVFEDKLCNNLYCTRDIKNIISINGQTYEKDWSVGIEGINKGYSRIKAVYTFNSKDVFDLNYEVDISRLFGNREYQSKFELESGRWRAYEVKFPGKKTVWIKLDESGSGNRVYEFSVKCYFNKNKLNVY